MKEPNSYSNIVAEPAAAYGSAALADGDFTDLDSQETQPVIMKAIDLGISQILRGETTPMDEVFAELDRKMGWA